MKNVIIVSIHVLVHSGEIKTSLTKTYGFYCNLYRVQDIFTNNGDAVIHDHELGVDVNHEALGLA